MHYSDTAVFKKKRTAAREKLNKTIDALAVEFDLTPYAVAHAICDSVLDGKDKYATDKTIPNGLAETYLPYVMAAANAPTAKVSEPGLVIKDLLFKYADDHDPCPPKFAALFAKTKAKKSPTTYPTIKDASLNGKAKVQGSGVLYGTTIVGIPNMTSGGYVNLPLQMNVPYNLTGQVLHSLGLTPTGLQYVLAGVGHGFLVDKISDKDMVSVTYLGPDSPVKQGLPGYHHPTYMTDEGGYDWVHATATKPPFHTAMLVVGGQVSEAVIAQYGLSLPFGYYFTNTTSDFVKPGHMLVTQEPF